MPIDISKNHYVQEFSVSFRYPVHFLRNVFDTGNNVLADTLNRLREDRVHRVQVFIDDGVIAAQPGIEERINTYFSAYSGGLEFVKPLQTVPGGERSKNSREAAEHVMESIARNRLCRSSFVLAIGGGSALDIIGLSASLVHRGVRLVRVPTTVLSQNDSGVGVKNGIDAYGLKNFAGTFAPPFAVLIDFDFLKTLPDKYWYGGLAEAFKVAIIKDREFFDYLRRHACLLRERNEEVIEKVIRWCALIHLEHIRTGGDPFEFGSMRPLDFGHWSAHWLEVQSGYAVGHGQAVAVGIALDSYYAWRSELLSCEQFDSVIETMISSGLPVWDPLLELSMPDGHPAVLRGLEDFREHLGGQLNVTLPRGIGDKVEVHKVAPDIVLDGIVYLKSFAENRQALS